MAAININQLGELFLRESPQFSQADYVLTKDYAATCLQDGTIPFSLFPESGLIVAFFGFFLD